MNTQDQATLDTLKSVKVFGVTNANDYIPGTPPNPAKVKAQQLFAALNDKVEAITGTVTNQQGGEGAFHSGTTSKAGQRQGLLDELRAINRSAGAISEAEGKPEIMDNFRMPHGNNDTVLAARANAFADSGDDAALKPKFIELGHDADFTDALRVRVENFENADDDQSSGQQTWSGATAVMGQRVREGVVIVKQLDALMNNLYKRGKARPMENREPRGARVHRESENRRACEESAVVVIRVAAREQDGGVSCFVFRRLKINSPASE